MRLARPQRHGRCTGPRRARNRYPVVAGFSLVNVAPLGSFTLWTTSFCRSSSSLCWASDMTFSGTEFFFCILSSGEWVSLFDPSI